ncbi:MAG TPA: sigma-54 dependent transcriptional regulator [Rhodanobacteraceae bacterium]|nr:sigma-54 dependent transcriptional regulator [Rhodanobacteraceae bacterium]
MDHSQARTELPQQERPHDQTPRARVLVVDDEAAIRKTFRYCLEDAGCDVTCADSAEVAENLVQRMVFDLCLLDLKLGNASGIDLLPMLRTAAPWMRVVMVTAHSSIDNAVAAMRAGASDYVIKPCSCEQLRAAAERQLNAQRMELRLEQLERAAGSNEADDALASRSPLMRQVVDTAHSAASADVTVLLLGESGTGKGMLARAIHRWSKRAKGPFVTVNAPSLSPTLFESELFGHRRGAFTGAVQNAAGRVSQADGGTLFLDEVGDVPMDLQPKLLRFMQDREYERVGDPVTRRANVRLVAATNHDLTQRVAEGAFREDLLYRLNVIALRLPGLRERPEDILPLAERFLAGFVTEHGRRPRGFTDAARRALVGYRWPGNVRELRNVIERASILCGEPQIDAQHLALGDGIAEPAAPTYLPQTLDELERVHIQSVLARSDTLENAARTLGIDVSTLYRKRKRYGV